MYTPRLKHKYKEEIIDKEDGIPEFIEKKVKSAG